MFVEGMYDSNRVLVGLRWWVEIDEKDKERWVFETRLTDKGNI